MEEREVFSAVAAGAVRAEAEAAETGSTPSSADAALIEFDVLVEDVSIDGMCGVY